MAKMARTNPPQSRRAQKREARVAQLLAHAMNIVSTEGRDALTIARLADEADAAVGALYRYFRGKGELLAMLQTRAAVSYGEFLQQRLDQLPEPHDAPSSLRHVVELFHAWAAFSEQHPILHGLIDESMSAVAVDLDEAQATQLWAKVLPLITLSNSVLDTAVANGALPAGDNPGRLTTLTALLHGMDHLRKSHAQWGDGDEWHSTWHNGVSSLMIGWGASRQHLDEVSSR